MKAKDNVLDWCYIRGQTSNINTALAERACQLVVVCRVLVLSGNMNLAVPTLGVNKVIRNLAWHRAGQLRETPTGLFRSGGRIGEGSWLGC